MAGETVDGGDVVDGDNANDRDDANDGDDSNGDNNVTQKENGILIRRISILIWSKNAYINMLKVAY